MLCRCRQVCGLWPDDQQKVQDELYTPLLNLLGRDVTSVVWEYIDVKDMAVQCMNYIAIDINPLYEYPYRCLFNKPHLSYNANIYDEKMMLQKRRMFANMSTMTSMVLVYDCTFYAIWMLEFKENGYFDVQFISAKFTIKL